VRKIGLLPNLLVQSISFASLYCNSSQRQRYITTDSQSASLGVEPNLGLLTRDIDIFFKVTVLSFGGALSDERSGLSFVSRV
jgi:hypothetical protein